MYITKEEIKKHNRKIKAMNRQNNKKLGLKGGEKI